MWLVEGVTGTFLLVILWLIWRKKKFSVLEKLGIPGPKPNILFGNLLELATEGALECHTKWTKQYGRVSGHYFGTKPIVLVADTDLLKKIEISEFQKFSNRPMLFDSGINKSSTVEIEGLENSLIDLRDKRWKEARSVITPSFTTSKMKLMSSIMIRAVDVLIENIGKKAEAKETFNIYDLYQGLSMDVIGRTAFGIQTDVQRNPDDPFLRTAKILVKIPATGLLSIISASFPELATLWNYLRHMLFTFQNKGRNPLKELTDSVVQIIKLRRSDKSARRNDLLQLMIDAEMSESDFKKLSDQDLVAGTDEMETEKGLNGAATKQPSKSLYHMTDQEIVDNCLLFLFAGFETTSTALAFITHFIIHYPEVQERIRKEVNDFVLQEGSLNYTSVHKLQYLDQVISEALRLYPPVHLFINREVGEDIKFGNMHIKKGLSIQVPVYVLHHDPELWSDPEKFDPERFSPENKSSNDPLAWQPFGAGPRNCVGMRFAQMEIKFALSTILKKYRLVPTDETDKDPLPLYASAAVIRPANGVRVKAIPI